MINYHKSISTLPYWNFIQARETKDLRYIFELDSYLDLSKAKPGLAHLKAFESILEEYNDVILKRDKPATLFDLQKQIGELESERFTCQLCLSQIKIFKGDGRYVNMVQKFIDELSELGYEYNSNIDALEGKIDAILNDIDDLKIAMNGLSGSGQGATTEQMVGSISKHIMGGTHLDIHKISVKQFLTYEDDYIRYVASLNKKTSNATN